MLSLMILLGLGTWILITIVVMRLCRRIAIKYFNHPNAGKWGTWTGFMLMMGGFIIYWVIEYIVTQIYVSHLCKGAGITVYITPEEFRKQIGEEKWKSLKRFHLSEEGVAYGEKDILIGNKQYYFSFVINPEVLEYYRYNKLKLYTSQKDEILIAKEKGNILMRQISYDTGVGLPWVSGTSWKIWLNNIQSCDEQERDRYAVDEYAVLTYKYSNDNYANRSQR